MASDTCLCVHAVRGWYCVSCLVVLHLNLEAESLTEPGVLHLSCWPASYTDSPFSATLWTPVFVQQALYGLSHLLNLDGTHSFKSSEAARCYGTPLIPALRRQRQADLWVPGQPELKGETLEFSCPEHGITTGNSIIHSRAFCLLKHQSLGPWEPPLSTISENARF